MPVSAEEGGTARDADLKRAADHNRLLPGELPQTLYVDDAQHWIRVYQDLLTFNADMLDGIDRRLSTSVS